MKILRNPAAFQKAMQTLRRKGLRLGFVPTMGALHEGHLSLVKAARKENNAVAVSIFVNPAQFGAKEDLSLYPRPFMRDKELLKKAGVDILFAPAVEAMYPHGLLMGVEVAGKALSLTQGLCGHSRPGHFRGVLTICAKLFNLAVPHAVYFGQKDYQQSVMIETLLRELNWDIRFHRLPTVRAADGLALSSRNAYLSEEEKQRARRLSQTLFNFRESLAAKKKNLLRLLQQARRDLAAHFDRLDYFEAVDPETLVPLAKAQPQMVVLGAVVLGKTRLIDNVIIH